MDIKCYIFLSHWTLFRSPSLILFLLHFTGEAIKT